MESERPHWGGGHAHYLGMWEIGGGGHVLNLRGQQVQRGPWCCEVLFSEPNSLQLHKMSCAFLRESVMTPGRRRRRGSEGSDLNIHPAALPGHVYVILS